MSVEELGRYLKGEWQRIREALPADRYQPQSVKRVEIAKPGGGVPQLGIPMVVDRMIQQALHQIMSREFEAGFSESSYGFPPWPQRPRRGAGDVKEFGVILGPLVALVTSATSFYDATERGLERHARTPSTRRRPTIYTTA